jgi:hypothetical protein
MIATQHYTIMKKGDLSKVEENNNVLWYDIDAPLLTASSTNQIFTLTTMIMEIHPHDETVPSTSKSTAEYEAFVGDFPPVSPASSNFVCTSLYLHSKRITGMLISP